MIGCFTTYIGRIAFFIITSAFFPLPNKLPDFLLDIHLCSSPTGEIYVKFISTWGKTLFQTKRGGASVKSSSYGSNNHHNNTTERKKKEC